MGQIISFQKKTMFTNTILDATWV